MNAMECYDSQNYLTKQCCDFVLLKILYFVANSKKKNHKFKAFTIYTFSLSLKLKDYDDIIRNHPTPYIISKK